jgi:hypothetical protein
MIFAGFHKRHAGHGPFLPPAARFSLNYQGLFPAAILGINRAERADITIIRRYAGGHS